MMNPLDEAVRMSTPTPQRPGHARRAGAASAARSLRPLQEADLPAVMDIELQAYPYPWSLGNFRDSLRQGYWMMSLRAAADAPLPLSEGGAAAPDDLLGYVVAMAGVQEVHLLNLTVAPRVQGQGHGRWLLDRLGDWARTQGAAQVWLEVRTGNVRARQVYDAYGFQAVGLRKGYYPASGLRREDAVVMRLDLCASHGAASTVENAG